MTRGGGWGGGPDPPQKDDIIYEQPLIHCSTVQTAPQYPLEYITDGPTISTTAQYRLPKSTVQYSTVQTAPQYPIQYSTDCPNNIHNSLVQADPQYPLQHSAVQSNL